MKQLFTIHEGEYIVGSFLENRKLNVWVPSKDIGVDFLVSDKQNRKTVSLQVKYSKDWLITSLGEFQDGLTACGWWTLNKKKIQQSKADFWVFVLYSFKKKHAQYLVINPKVLLRRFKRLKKTGNTLQVYFWFTEKGRAWETRGLKKADQKRIAVALYENSARDFSEYLENWQPVFRKLK
jgi:hypothetical protein